MSEKINRYFEKSRFAEERIERTNMVNFDGKQFFIRLPKKISDFLNIKKGDKLRFTLDTKYVSESRKKIMVVELID